MAFAFIDLKKQYECLKTEIDAAMAEVLTAGQYINGPAVGALEKELSEYCGVKETICVANGTEALMLPLLYWGLGAGDAVFCPSFTFIATAEVISLRGASPIFVDIDPHTYNMCPKDLSNKILAVKKEGKLKPKAIISVDLFGLPADYESLEKIAKEHDLLLLEDAAQGFGGRLKEKKACSFGQAAGTSFFPAKPLGCYGDGGAIMTNDVEMAAALRSLRTHGSGTHKYEHVRIGVNSRLDTLQAAVLRVKLKAFPKELTERQRVADFYTKKLAGLLETPHTPAGYLSSWAQYTVRVAAEKREIIMEALKNKGVPSMVYYPKPLHLQPAFAQAGAKVGDLPHSEKAAAEVMSLPMHPYLSNDELALICESIQSSL